MFSSVKIKMSFKSSQAISNSYTVDNKRLINLSQLSFEKVCLHRRRSVLLHTGIYSAD